MADKVKYLDLAGLTTYDGKIKRVIDSKVADGIAAIPTSEITSVESGDGQDSNKFTIVYRDNKGAEKGTEFIIGTPTLSTEVHPRIYGLMSSADKDAIAGLTTKVDNLVTVGGEPNKINTISLNNKTVSFTVDATKNADLTLDVDYDTTTKKVRLKSGEKILSSFDASAFIKDGMLNSAEIITVPSEGNEATTDRPAGKYIKLTWNTDAGKDATYIPVKDIIKEYAFLGSTAGCSFHKNETRGNVIMADTLTATTQEDGTILVRSGATMLESNWFDNVDQELDAIPTTYAKAADVTTGLAAKADKAEIPTVNVSDKNDVVILESLNYGQEDHSLQLGLNIEATGDLYNKYTISINNTGVTDWIGAIDTQVKTNADAIAADKALIEAIPTNYAAKSHKHVIADITDFGTITTEDIDALFV